MLHLLALYFGWPNGGTWSNVIAAAECTGAAGSTAWVFRDHIGRRLSAWWRKHHGDHIAPALAEHAMHVGVTLHNITTRLDFLTGAVAALRPVHVDVSAELGKSIVAKLTDPLTVPASTSAEWASIAQHGQVVMRYPLGWGSRCGMLSYTIQPGGRLLLEIHDENNARVWQGELHPPA